MDNQSEILIAKYSNNQKLTSEILSQLFVILNLVSPDID